MPSESLQAGCTFLVLEGNCQRATVKQFQAFKPVQQTFASTFRNLLIFISVLLLDQDLQLHHAPLMDQAVRSRNAEKREGKEEEQRQDKVPGEQQEQKR